MLFRLLFKLNTIQWGQTISIEATDELPALTVNLWTPQTDSAKPLPLLIVMDGERYFNYAISMHDLIQDYGWAPPFAVLGVNTSPNRWSKLSGQRQEILELLDTKILPFIEKNYPVSQERILFGWEAAGGFTLKSVIDKPDMFTGFIASSPSPLYGEYFPTLQSQHQRLVETLTSSGKGKHLYVAQGSYDYPQYLGINQLNNALDSASGDKPRYRFETIEDATHSDLGFETLLRGVRDYFYYFDKPQFSSLQAFETAGGHKYLDAYYKKQTQQFGLTDDEVAKNRFELVRKLSFMPLMDGDLKAFQNYFKQLEDTDFLDRSHVNHIYRYGLFLLQQKDTTGAQSLFEYISKREPDNALPVNGLGLVAKARKENGKAIELFEKAVQMGEKDHDYRLPEYQHNLDAMKR